VNYRTQLLNARCRGKLLEYGQLVFRNQSIEPPLCSQRKTSVNALLAEYTRFVIIELIITDRGAIWIGRP
jgi:hypothetical protein